MKVKCSNGSELFINDNRDYINFNDMRPWLAESLKERRIFRISQVIGRTEEELLENSFMTIGIVRHLEKYLERHGYTLLDGNNSLIRLGLHKPNLKYLRNNGIMNLSDLEDLTVYELAYDYGMGEDRARFIANRMLVLGRRMRA